MDTLIYRFPDEATIKRSGTFFRLKSVADYQGFFVSDFMQQNNYGFTEDAVHQESQAQKHPIIYSADEYHRKAEEFLDDMKSTGLRKAVFSRIRQVGINSSAEQIFDALEKSYPTAFVYLISSELFGTWVGATPEVLIESENDVLRTMALAGTRRAEDNTPWGEKELDEQQIVTEYIAELLQESGLDYTRDENPRDQFAGPVKHLVTGFRIRNRENALELARKLHPTPAVSGLPVKEALDLIAKHETHDRELYSGFLGMTGVKNQLYVNLRCAKLLNDKLYLYLGGGFTKDSDVKLEWEETENKAKTILNVLENL